MSDDASLTPAEAWSLLQAERAAHEATRKLLADAQLAIRHRITPDPDRTTEGHRWPGCTAEDCRVADEAGWDVEKFTVAACIQARETGEQQMLDGGVQHVSGRAHVQLTVAPEGERAIVEPSELRAKIEYVEGERDGHWEAVVALTARINELSPDVETAQLRAVFAKLRERHSTMTIQWTRAKQDRAWLMAALEKARPYVLIESQRPTILAVVPARADIAEIDALLAALRTAPAEPPSSPDGAAGQETPR